MMLETYSVAWYELVQMFVRKFGCPLPRELMEIGDPDDGWYARYDRKDKPEIGENPVMIRRNGWPAGACCQDGGSETSSADKPDAGRV